MRFHVIRCLLTCTLAVLTHAAVAQDESAAATSAPKAESPAVTSSLQFNSTFVGYQAYTEQAVGSWREANDNVGRIGGWRSYAREAAGPDSAADPKDHGSQGGKR